MNNTPAPYSPVEDFVFSVPSVWARRTTKYTWRWDSEKLISGKPVCTVYMDLGSNRTFYEYSVSMPVGGALTYSVRKSHISMGNFVLAIKRGCDKIDAWITAHRTDNVAMRGLNHDLLLGTLLMEVDKMVARKPLSKMKEDCAQVAESRIASAAIRIKDGRVFTGSIHCIALSKMQDEGIVSAEEEDLEKELANLGAEFGWLDDKGRFLTRRQAYKLATASGQIADIYGPHRGLTHDMLSDVNAVWNIPEAFTCSTAMPIFKVVERTVKRLLNEDDKTIDPAGFYADYSRNAFKLVLRDKISGYATYNVLFHGRHVGTVRLLDKHVELYEGWLNSLNEAFPYKDKLSFYVWVTQCIVTGKVPGYEDYLKQQGEFPPH